MMKQDESVLKTLEKKTTQEIRQSPRLHKTKTKKSMKQEKSVFKTPEKKTTQEIRQSPRLKMIEYKKSVTPIKVEDSLVKKESDEKITDITPELVHDLLGIPLGGKDIYNTDQCEGKELMDWKQQYNFKAMRPSDVEEKIKESSDSGIIFRTNFVLLFVNTICEQNKPGTCKTTVLPHLLGKTPMREIDWCGFITNCLKMSKTKRDETDRGNYYCGSLLVLLLAYLEFMRNDKNEKRQIHALHFWDYEMMVKREKAELKSGDFGTLEWNDDVIENDEESDTDENEDMKLDELVFKAKNDYKKLVNDKMKFGKLIEFSTTKFTESDELKDMKKVFEQEFIYKTQNEDDAKGDRDEDEKKSEENLNEHEIKNQTIMVTPGNLYNDPIVHEIADSIQCILNFENYDDFENVKSFREQKIDDKKKKKNTRKSSMPSFSLGLGLGLTQEFHEGDESSEDEHMKKEIKDEKLDEGESYDSEETECDNNILGIEDDEDKKRERQFIFDKNIPFNQRFDKFESNIKDAMKKDKELLPFEKVHLVFLPVHQKNHFYIICINLEEPAVDVIDNRNSVAKFSRAYRDAPNELVLDEGQSQISFNFGGC
ncbi:unnamed protein product [Lactuca virosa]|uniref:Ubiquitin-like protease family profile domain-containing protein n=1 Tax=Lactuca virosa TaxID=75947 RepID=A0AAU9MXT1_9ASTR|nr:unnamed protein product [Lactuca virosa]